VRAYTIRDARTEERMAIGDLTFRAYSEYARIMEPAAWAGLESALTAALASDVAAERIVADDDGTLIGSAMLFPAHADAYRGEAAAPHAPEVRLVAVAPEARGRGVAKALMEECVRRARAAGATELGIHTSRSMRAAITLYERMGFVRVPERDFRPAGAELVEGYRLRLA
jgi:GNAT superfamily N-acetyltransferase